MQGSTGPQSRKRWRQHLFPWECPSGGDPQAPLPHVLDGAGSGFSLRPDERESALSQFPMAKPKAVAPAWPRGLVKARPLAPPGGQGRPRRPAPRASGPRKPLRCRPRPARPFPLGPPISWGPEGAITCGDCPCLIPTGRHSSVSSWLWPLGQKVAVWPHRLRPHHAGRWLSWGLSESQPPLDSTPLKSRILFSFRNNFRTFYYFYLFSEEFKKCYKSNRLFGNRIITINHKENINSLAVPWKVKHRITI